jgi:hypothetical protein
LRKILIERRDRKKGGKNSKKRVGKEEESNRSVGREREKEEDWNRRIGRERKKRKKEEKGLIM